VARVTFQRITCRDTQETFSDEPYLHYNGQHLAGPFSDVDEGEGRNINLVRDLVGTGLVELFESDGPDADDFLAAFEIFEGEAGQGQKAGALKGDGARYTLFYFVE
jgi:hypothetical protein